MFSVNRVTEIDINIMHLSICSPALGDLGHSGEHAVA